MAEDERPDLSDPEVLHQIFDGFAQEMGQIIESQKRLVAMTNYLSGESLAMRAVLSALRQKSGVTVSVEEAMAALIPLMRPEMLCRVQFYARRVAAVLKHEWLRLSSGRNACRLSFFKLCADLEFVSKKKKVPAKAHTKKSFAIIFTFYSTNILIRNPIGARESSKPSGILIKEQKRTLCSGILITVGSATFGPKSSTRSATR